MKRLGLLAGLLSLCASSEAAIIYMSEGFDDGLCNGNCSGMISDYQLGSSSYFNEAAERFVLDADYTIDGLSWTGSSYGAGNFTINFYNETVNGLPAATAFASYYIGNDYNLLGRELFSADIMGLNLVAEVPYYVSIVANNTSSPYDWGWNGSSGAHYQRGRSPDGVSWWINPNFDAGSLGLLLHGAATVPEPGSLALFLGMGMVGFVMRRRRSSPN